jgi:hypothetical protein
MFSQISVDGYVLGSALISGYFYDLSARDFYDGYCPEGPQETLKGPGETERAARNLKGPGETLQDC